MKKYELWFTYTFSQSKGRSDKIHKKTLWKFISSTQKSWNKLKRAWSNLWFPWSNKIADYTPPLTVDVLFTTTQIDSFFTGMKLIVRVYSNITLKLSKTNINFCLSDKPLWVSESDLYALEEIICTVWTTKYAVFIRQTNTKTPQQILAR